MILNDQKENASRYLTKFSKLVRHILENAEASAVTLESEMTLLESYIQLEGLRLPGRIGYSISIDKSIGTQSTYLPSMLLQPVVENAIWHGLMPKKGDKKITVRFFQSGDFVTCIIEDNGIGIYQSEKMNQFNKQPHVGLENLRSRIKIMNEKYDMNCTLDIRDLSENNIHRTGTLATLRFKILTL